MQTVSNLTTRYIWKSSSSPFSYTNFADILKLGMKSRVRNPRSVEELKLAAYGYYPTQPPPPYGDCNCGDYCPEAPVCVAPNCTINVPDCAIDQPYCEIDHTPSCYILDPQPQCTVSCPPCTIQRGTCTVTRDKCTVKPGHCTTTRGNCKLEQPVCTVTKGKCSLISQPCIIERPPPCHKPPICSYKPTCDPLPGSGYPQPQPGYESPNSKPVFPDRKYDSYHVPCTGYNCSKTTPAPCQGSECKCYQVFHCVPDIVCVRPPVICPPAIHHCLPAEVQCTEPHLVCDESETTCTPPEVYCPPYEKNCTQDIITCPAPTTTCTPAVSHCPRAEYTCDKPSITCNKPSVYCDTKPDCEIPPPCFNDSSYGPNNGNNNCYCKNGGKRYKRSLTDENGIAVLEPEEILETKCVSMKKAFGYKWALEECQKKNYFICESDNNNPI